MADRAVVIRRCGNVHLINDLDRECLPFDDPYTYLRDAAWWVAWDGTEPVAFGGFRPIEGAAFLCRAGVIPSHRGLGLQRRLIRVRLAAARRCGFGWAHTYTANGNCVSANNLIRCGFRLFEPSWYWGGTDALYLCRDL